MLKSRQERPDRLDGDTVLGGAWNGSKVGRYPDIDRQNIVGDGRPACEQHTLGAAIYSDRFRVDEAGSGHGRQPDEIDVRLLPRIEARDNARQHARIWRIPITGG